MANTKVLVFYILFLIFFSTLSGFFYVEDKNKTILFENILYTKTKDAVNTGIGFLDNAFKIVLAPLLVIDVLSTIIALVSISFISIPPILSSIILAPMVFIIIIDYVLPMIRGN